MDILTPQAMRIILSDFVRLSEEVTCPNCGKTTKMVGETRVNGNWICPECLAVFPYKTKKLAVSAPFVKLTNQLLKTTAPLSPVGLGPLGDPPTETFPLNMTTGFLVPSYSYKIKRKRNALLGQASDFTRYGRIKSGSIWQFDLVFNGRARDEFEVLVAFANTVGYHIPFNYHDAFRGSDHICYFDSDVSDGDVTSFDEISFSVRITE